MLKTKTAVRDLIIGIESVKLKNRDLLSGDEIKILDECLTTLKELQSLQELDQSLDLTAKALRVVETLLRFLADNDAF